MTKYFIDTILAYYEISLPKALWWSINKKIERDKEQEFKKPEAVFTEMKQEKMLISNATIVHVYILHILKGK